MALVKDLEGEDYEKALQRAKENYDRAMREADRTGNWFKPDTLDEIDNKKLTGAFVFDETEEGHRYWMDLVIEIDKKNSKL